VTKKILDVGEALKLLEAVVKERGADYVYTDHWSSCQNFIGPQAVRSYNDTPDDELSTVRVENAKDKRFDQPLCIVGHVLAKEGLRPSIHGKQYALGSVHTISVKLGNDPAAPFKLTSDAREVLAAAQVSQDRGDSWGTALQYAVKEAENLGIPS
jgi:hypothetical protein